MEQETFRVVYISGTDGATRRWVTDAYSGKHAIDKFKENHKGFLNRVTGASPVESRVMRIFEYQDGDIIAKDEEGKVHVLSTEIPVSVKDTVKAYMDCGMGCCWTIYAKEDDEMKINVGDRLVCEDEVSNYFTYGDEYEVISKEFNEVMVIDDEGDEHTLSGSYLRGYFHLVKDDEENKQEIKVGDKFRYEGEFFAWLTYGDVYEVEGFDEEGDAVIKDDWGSEEFIYLDEIGDAWVRIEENKPEKSLPVFKPGDKVRDKVTGEVVTVKKYQPEYSDKGEKYLSHKLGFTHNLDKFPWRWWSLIENFELVEEEEDEDMPKIKAGDKFIYNGKIDAIGLTLGKSYMVGYVDEDGDGVFTREDGLPEFIIQERIGDTWERVTEEHSLTEEIEPADDTRKISANDELIGFVVRNSDNIHYEGDIVEIAELVREYDRRNTGKRKEPQVGDMVKVIEEGDTSEYFHAFDYGDEVRIKEIDDREKVELKYYCYRDSDNLFQWLRPDTVKVIEGGR